MGILRLKNADRSFLYIAVFCAGCDGGLTYAGFNRPMTNKETVRINREYNQYYEDVETELVYCTSCVDSGIIMKVKV